VKVKKRSIESSRMNREIQSHPISGVKSAQTPRVTGKRDSPHSTQIVTQCRVNLLQPISPAVNQAMGTSATPNEASMTRIVV
jgi:hypothetical protein